jgi:hypothetical protein
MRASKKNEKMAAVLWDVLLVQAWQNTHKTGRQH